MATEFEVFPNSVRPIRGISSSLTGEGNPLNLSLDPLILQNERKT